MFLRGKVYVFTVVLYPLIYETVLFMVHYQFHYEKYWYDFLLFCTHSNLDSFLYTDMTIKEDF